MDSGQSAAEIDHDLLSEIDVHGYRLNWVTRSPRFFPLEYTKLTLEMTAPDYKGIDGELIDAIFDLLYRMNLPGPAPTRLLTNSALERASYAESTATYTLGLRQEERGTDYRLDTEGLILATGYRYEDGRMPLPRPALRAGPLAGRRPGDGTATNSPLKAMEFFVELRSALHLSAEILPVCLEEISSTLAGSAYKPAKEPTTSAQLVVAGFQAIETGMPEGHPCFVANNGRLGFGVDEYRAYAPEAAAGITLVRPAARRDHATFTAGAGLDHPGLVTGELGEETRDHQQMVDLGDPAGALQLAGTLRNPIAGY